MAVRYGDDLVDVSRGGPSEGLALVGGSPHTPISHADLGQLSGRPHGEPPARRGAVLEAVSYVEVDHRRLTSVERCRVAFRGDGATSALSGAEVESA